MNGHSKELSSRGWFGGLFSLKHWTQATSLPWVSDLSVFIATLFGAMHHCSGSEVSINNNLDWKGLEHHFYYFEVYHHHKLHHLQFHEKKKNMFTVCVVYWLDRCTEIEIPQIMWKWLWYYKAWLMRVLVFRDALFSHLMCVSNAAYILLCKVWEVCYLRPFWQLSCFFLVYNFWLKHFTEQKFMLMHK